MSGERLAKLRDEVPKELIKTRTQGGKTIKYLDWTTVADILDHHSSTWSYSIKEVKELAKMIVVTVALTVDGVTRENTGCEDLDIKGFGDPVSNAVAMAFKRAAALFGVGRDLYQTTDVMGILEKYGEEPQAKAAPITKPKAVEPPKAAPNNKEAKQRLDIIAQMYQLVTYVKNINREELPDRVAFTNQYTKKDMEALREIARITAEKAIALLISEISECQDLEAQQNGEIPANEVVSEEMLKGKTPDQLWVLYQNSQTRLEAMQDELPA